MDRRRFVALIGGSLAAPLVGAQPRGKVFRVGYPSISGHGAMNHLLKALELGLRDHGYIVGRDIVIEFRSADGKIERYPEVVAEVVRSNPDVIVTGVNANTTAVKALTQTIPVVMILGADVVGKGYVKSLARPGGNITGFTVDVGPDLSAKRLELFKEMVPSIARLAVLRESPYTDQLQSTIDKAAAKFGLTTFWLDYSGDLERDFAAMGRWRADAVFLQPGARLYHVRAALAALAAKHRLPVSYSISEFVDAGGLMSYSPNISAQFRAAARYIDKILKGAKPGDLPVEQPAKIELVINIKTAKALGLKIPPSILLRADQVIE